jgi:probable HAF family extracellular repeat protein
VYRFLHFSMGVLLLAGVVVASSGGAPAARSYGAIDLGTLGGDASAAQAVSPLGQIVGQSIARDGRWHAFSWTSSGKMVDLGTLGEPYVNSSAIGVNAAGQVVGVASPVGGNESQRGFFWAPGGGLVDLGTIGSDTIVEPAAINANGQIAGSSWSPNTQSHGFSWTQAGGIVDIGSLGGTGVRAYDINDSGEIVGVSGRGRVTQPGPHAFLWSASGGMRDLGTLGGTASEAVAINQSGQIVGWGMTASQQTHAFFWSTPTGIVDLGTLGGPTSRALAIADSGQVVGVSTTAAGTTHGFSWTQAGGMVDLGTLGGDISIPTGASSAGQVVGYSTNASGAERPFLWESGKMSDLGSLQASQGRALAVNDRSQIVGYSHSGGGWSPKALLWSQVVVKPLIGEPSAKPATPLAGRRFLVSFKVTRSDSGMPLTTGAMTCDPTVSGKTVAHADSFKSGTVRLVMTVPRAAKGKLLKVKVRVVVDGRSATRMEGYRVR